MKTPYRMGDGKDEAEWLIMSDKTPICSLEIVGAASGKDQKALGAFIIKACNNHQKLVQLLQRATDRCDCLENGGLSYCSFCKESNKILNELREE